MKKLILLLLVGTLAPRSAAAVEGARWLLSAEGVQSAALGNAVAALQASPEQAWSNPAGIAGIDGVEASFSHLSFPGAWDSDHIVLAAPFHWKHHLALLYHRNAAEDTLRDILGNESGDFEVSQSALMATYAYKATDWRLGASVKSLSEVIQSRSGAGLAYDLGLQGDLVRDRVIVGAAVQNLGSVPDLGGPTIEAPLLVRSGADLRFKGEVSTLDLLVDYRYRPVSLRSGVSVGVEYSEHYLDGRLALRAGYDNSQADQGNGAGFALGAGFGYGPVGLDYAWTPHGDLGSQHRVALTLLWDLRARARSQALEQSLGPVSAKPDLQVAPAPGPKAKGYMESHVGERLDDLLNATPEPTPMTTPLPTVAVSKPPAKGILGFFARLFGAAPKAEETGPAPVDEHPGILRSVFHFLGFGGGAPAPLADSPERANQDSFVGEGTPIPTAATTPLPIQRLKGDAGTIEPTPTAVPVKEKVKDWMKF